MRCLNPRTVGFQADGRTISWSQKSFSKEYSTFQLPCSKCIECRLEYARQWAVRCVHEASMYEKNSFITLTYSDEHLKPRLDYRDFQLFAKKLRKSTNEKIGYFVTGEYGELQKRPHWHAIIFNWSPGDARPKYTNGRGDVVSSSTQLDTLWGKGICDAGSVTFESAGYCARYAAKKLVHGKDDQHDYRPISKKSSRQAIGKKWLETYWQDAFSYGYIILPDGKQTSIPRYYEKWLLQNHPEAWTDYVTRLKAERIAKANEREAREYNAWVEQSRLRKLPLIKKLQRRKIIIEEKFKQLQKHLKGDI
nr:MAG: replication initiator protein [Microvirus sp.]